MKKLNPLRFLAAIIVVIKELRHYMYYRKTVAKLRDSGELAAKGLRVDKLLRIYYVHNLSAEVLLYGKTEAGDLLKFEKRMIAESLRPYNPFFIENQLIEVIKTHTERIKTPDYYAYLVWINFRFREVSFSRIMYILMYSFGLFLLVKYLIGKYAIISSWITTAYDYVSNLL